MIFKTIDNLLDEVEQLSHKFVDGMTRVKASRLGLDPRAGYCLYVNEDCIAANYNDARLLDYYGGFEYVEREFRVQCGSYIFYLREDSRVDDHITRYFNNLEQHLITPG